LKNIYIFKCKNFPHRWIYIYWFTYKTRTLARTHK